MATDTVEIWPEHVDAFNLFSSMGTCWRVGMSGPTGLEYMVLYHRMDRMNLTPERYSEIEHDIQVLESTALSIMNKPAEK